MKRPMCPPGTSFFSIRSLGAPTRSSPQHLLPGRDLVALSREEVNGASDRLEVQAAAEPHELALGETVLLKELADRFQLPAPGRVERIFVPAVEHLDPLLIRWIVHILVRIRSFWSVT